MKKLAVVFLFALLVTGAFAQTLSISQIRTKWSQLKPKTVANMYVREPSMKEPFNYGRLYPDFIANATNTLNFARYLAGLPEVSTDLSTNMQCQAGAQVLALNGALSHNPPQPKGMGYHDGYEQGREACAASNLHWNSGDNIPIEWAVKSWLNDSDPSNIGSLGHRRWALNPQMKTTGFGYNNFGRGTYVLMYAFDNKGTAKKERVLWPSEGYFPTDFFAPDQAWSISLDSSVYSNTAANIANISVKLTCLNNNKTWTFTKADTNKSGKYFKVDTGGYGMNFCIIFRPDGITSYGGSTNKFKVEVTGLKGVKNNALPTMTYSVEFFSL